MSRFSISRPYLSLIGFIVDLILSKIFDFDLNFDFDDMIQSIIF